MSPIETASEFVVIHYNVHSLIKFEERIDRLLFELGDQHWDILVFSETWREEEHEEFITEHGQVRLGSGGTKGLTGSRFPSAPT